MLFVEFRFLLFLGVFFLIYWSFRSVRSRNLLIVIGSYAFYAVWDWRFLGLIFLSTAIDYICAIRIDESKNERVRRIWLILSLVVNLGILGFFKYFNFFGEQLDTLVSGFGGSLDFTTLNIILPVGISFYTLQTMSYTLDVFTRRSKPNRDPVTVAAYVAFFPQLVAGPILRAHTFMPQLETARKWIAVPVQACLLLFLIGFFKKTVLADNISVYVDAVFADPTGFTYLSVLGGLAGFTIQIYCDFSGYSDMAIAAAGLLGFRMNHNFYMPALVTNFSEYRRRWHISLTEWLRDYLYYPLGGGRRGRLRTYLNLFIVNVAAGIWHGAAWTFVAWGTFGGVAVVCHRLLHNFLAKRSIHIPFRGILGWLLTMYLLMVSNSLFRGEQISDSMAMVAISSGLLTPGSQSLALNPLVLVPPLLLAQWAFHRFGFAQKVEALSATSFAIFFGVAVALTYALQKSGVRDFYYFQF